MENWTSGTVGETSVKQLLAVVFCHAHVESFDSTVPCATVNEVLVREVRMNTVPRQGGNLPFVGKRKKCRYWCAGTEV